MLFKAGFSEPPHCDMFNWTKIIVQQALVIRRLLFDTTVSISIDF
jgi:hypothetical protein